LRIVAFAYACEPGEGSEPGAGWIWARMLARLGETWVITRANNQILIDAELPHIPEADRLHFVYTDLPPALRFWKRGRGAILPYYVLWQFSALREARRLQRDIHFDLVWHLTLANGWLGSTGALVGPPFVYGPVGGGATVPWSMVPVLGPRGIAEEGLRLLVRAVGRYLSPLSRLAWNRARLILVQNRDTRSWMPRRHRAKIEVFPHVVLSGDQIDRRSSKPSLRPLTTALFAGRLLGWKGVTLAIRAISLLDGWTLLICGSGPDELRLKRLSQRLGVQERVRFLGRVPRERLLRLMEAEAGVLLFPSLRDEAGWVVVEALSRGMPVICLESGGPPELGGAPVPIRRPSRAVELLARSLVRASRAPVQSSRDFSPESVYVRLETLLAKSGITAPIGDP
jgi:glycosyltransferase involved in cell wall biosynthesis